MLIDALAERYGCLPSQVLREGDTFDLMVLDVTLTYRKYEEELRSGTVSPEVQKRMFGGTKKLEEYFYSIKEKHDSKSSNQ